MNNDALIKSEMGELPFSSSAMFCFDISDWQKARGSVLAPRRVASFGAFPGGNEVLDSPCPFHPHRLVRDTHAAFACIGPMHILALQELGWKSLRSRSRSWAADPWYFSEKFAKETLKFQWYLLLRDIVPGSENRTFNEQKRMLPVEYSVPPAVAEVAKDQFLYRKLGICVNSKCYARTASRDSVDLGVAVGACDTEGCVVTRFTSDYRNEMLGIAAARRLT